MTPGCLWKECLLDFEKQHLEVKSFWLLQRGERPSKGQLSLSLAVMLRNSFRPPRDGLMPMSPLEFVNKMTVPPFKTLKIASWPFG